MGASIHTARLTLVPATVALARAEIADRAAFARLLDAVVPDEWPPESAADALPMFLEWLEAAPDRAGWYSWYALIRDAGGDAPAPGTEGVSASRPVLGAGGGFLGPPVDGEVALGYAVLPRFRRRGYATEMSGALVGWAFAHAEVARITAETEWANPASVGVLTRLGFAAAGRATEPGGERFVLSRSGSLRWRRPPADP